MGRPKQPLPAELEDLRVRFQAWRQTRKNGERLPKELWSEASGLARRVGINRVSEALRLNHTTLKEHAAKGRMVTRPVKRPRPAPVQPAFVELDGGHLPGDHLAGPMVEVTRPGGERMVLRWQAGSVVDSCGLVAAFLGRGR